MARKKKTRRIYRLRDLLKHFGACPRWQAYVAEFETAAEVFADINGSPYLRVAGFDGAAYDARAFVYMRSPERSETERVFNTGRRGPLTRRELDVFVRWWIEEADRHGLYTEVPA